MPKQNTSISKKIMPAVKQVIGVTRVTIPIPAKRFFIFIIYTPSSLYKLDVHLQLKEYIYKIQFYYITCKYLCQAYFNQSGFAKYQSIVFTIPSSNFVSGSHPNSVLIFVGSIAYL